MRISELIVQLANIRAEEGDLEVCMMSSPTVWSEAEVLSLIVVPPGQSLYGLEWPVKTEARVILRHDD
jgi:hypothetical protein